VIQADVASSSDRELIVKEVREKCATGLDCLVNNAGYGLAGPLESLSEQQIRQQFEVNFFAPLLLIRDLLPSLRKSGGKVINISSVLGFVGMPLQSLYVASKFALEGLSESLSYELAAHGIQICLVEPGGFRTKFAQNIQWAKGIFDQTSDSVISETSRSTIASSESNSSDAWSSELYEKQMRGYRALLSKRLERPGSNPKQVAQAVFDLCGRSSVPLRVRLGTDSQALYYMRRSLPQKVGDLILHTASKKMLEVH
jgi:NAD(P)-dependent dehydrogenase (short-subunit alcohol dehydrogenase family)